MTASDQTTIKHSGREALDEAIACKVTPSNVEYDAYTHGLCNGLLLARAILDGTPVTEAKRIFAPAPAAYYVDRPYEPSRFPPTPHWQNLLHMADDAGRREEEALGDE